MSFIELDGLNDVKEPELAPEGEYDLRITHAEDYVKDDGSNKTVLRVSLAFDGHPEYASMNHWMVLHDPAHDEDQKTLCALRVARFLTLFNVPFESGFEVEDLFGAVASNAYVAQSAADDEGRIFNELRVPRMKS